ncbi:MAG: YegS/Rv2252/BmrU family lipid kinase [Phyllobacteriaceae bacterium]|nr:YegS/Rv2252/BmrU family lipid kinase [Phyllobacteriaceae bacterium]
MARPIDEAFPDNNLVTTAARGAAGRLAHETLARGSRLIVVAGGNGVANEVADALLSTGLTAAELPELALIPVGVGVDLARGLGIPRDANSVMARLADPGATRLIDAGRVTYVGDGGGSADRYFLNCVSAGISAGIAASVNSARRVSFVPGQALFFMKSVQAVLSHRFSRMTVSVDGAVVTDEETALVAVANGRFLGGGMAIAPDAEMDDGLFDVVVIRGASKLYMLDNMNKIYSGAHRNMPEVTITKGREVRIAPTETTGFEIDGETPGHAPLQIDMLRGALRVRA